MNNRKEPRITGRATARKSVWRLSFAQRLPRTPLPPLLPLIPLLLLLPFLLLALALPPSTLAQEAPTLTIDDVCMAAAYAPDGRIAYAARHVYKPKHFELERDDI